MKGLGQERKAPCQQVGQYGGTSAESCGDAGAERGRLGARAGLLEAELTVKQQIGVRCGASFSAVGSTAVVLLSE